MTENHLNTIDKSKYRDILVSALQIDKEQSITIGKGNRQAWYSNISEITKLSGYTDESKQKARLVFVAELMKQTGGVTEDFPYYPEKELYLNGELLKKHDKYLGDGIDDLEVGSDRRNALVAAITELLELCRAAKKVYEGVQAQYEEAERKAERKAKSEMDEMEKLYKQHFAPKRTGEVNSNQLLWMFLAFVVFLVIVFIVF